MSETTTASLKQEILEWAMKPGSPKNFTTHDVYEYIHSAETSRQTSEALRSMWRYDKTLDREEFMDGNKKRFVYSLKTKSVSEKLKDFLENNSGVDQELIDKAIQAGVVHGSLFPNDVMRRLKNKVGAIPETSVMSKSTAEISNEPIISPAYVSGITAGKGIANTNNNQQIEIPNNFCIELKTPNGFTITIKAEDLIK